MNGYGMNKIIYPLVFTGALLVSSACAAHGGGGHFHGGGGHFHGGGGFPGHPGGYYHGGYYHGHGGWGWGGTGVIVGVPFGGYYPPACQTVRICNHYGHCWLQQECD